MRQNAHHHPERDREAAIRQEAWRKEWDAQFFLLPKEKRDDILADPMSPYADELDEQVEKILCGRDEL